MSLKEQVKAFLFRRQAAYRRTFDPGLASTDRVLKDLAKFCRATKPTFHADARIHATLEGRREVWLRIQNHLNLTDEQLWQLTSGDSE